MGSDGIIHNTEDRLASDPCFVVNNVNDCLFKDILQSLAIPFPVIKEMGNCSPMAGAAGSKINGLAMVAPHKNSEQYSHDVF